MSQDQKWNLSTVAGPMPEASPLDSFDVFWTSTGVYDQEYLVEICDKYLVNVEQGNISIREFSIENIQESYDHLMLEDEKEFIRYRLEALEYLRKLDKNLSANENWSWNEWKQIHKKVKHLVPSRLQKYYLKWVEAIQPERPNQSEQEVPMIDLKLTNLYGETYQNLPRPLRYWLRDQIASHTHKTLEAHSAELLKQLDEEWERLRLTSTKEEWWGQLQTTVLYQESKNVAEPGDWIAIYSNPFPFEHWDQILRAAKNQLKQREREEQNAIENEGASSTLHVSSISKITGNK